MSDQFIGEIRIFGFNFAPQGWAFCQGQIMSISQNTALFSILGTNYGGNGTSNFGLPNFQGNVPMHWGNGAGLTSRVVGETGGESSVQLLSLNVPAHTHSLLANISPSNLTIPNGARCYARSNPGFAYAPVNASLSTMAPEAIGAAGGGQAHNNLQPYLVLNFCIALVGIFPSRG